jgi:hypothetical protein
MSKPDPVAPALPELNKADIETVESIHKPAADTHGKDKAAQLLASNERIIVTPADD